MPRAKYDDKTRRELVQNRCLKYNRDNPQTGENAPINKAKKKNHWVSKRSRNDAIRDRVKEMIELLPVGAEIDTRTFSKDLGKVKGWIVESTHMRVFLRELDCLEYKRRCYVKVKL